MKITATEIKQHEFEKAFRGYDIEEVDIFLNSLANEWDRLSNENKMLRMQLEIAEKEASKLREVEITLIKTLKSAEETSNKITENSRIEAERLTKEAQKSAEEKLEEASKKATVILQDAENKANALLEQAKTEISEKEKARTKAVQELDLSLNKLQKEKDGLLLEIKRIKEGAEQLLGFISEVPVVDKEPSAKTVLNVEPEIKDSQSIPAKREVENITEPEDLALEEMDEQEPIVSIASGANKLGLENKTEDNLEEIEGIGPKIADLLKIGGIHSFRDLATTPSYRIKDLLQSSGPQFAMHDPSTWAKQALLAAEEKWEELEALKKQLVAGKISDNADSMPIENATEEMLDRVNKVKAALRKAMQEKESIPTKNDASPKTETLNDILAKQRKEEGGSFFDQIN